MTAMQKAMNAYGQASETIPPAKQIVMLYDGVLRHVKAAAKAIDDRRINDRYIAVQKATLIIEALQGCLDHEHGGDIAPRLDQLYTHFIFRLQAINIDDDVAICDDILERVGELRASWAAVAESEAGEGQNGSLATDQLKTENSPALSATVTA